MRIERPAHERGHANHGWLDTHHTFSFASYYDPDHMGFRSLRVINEDRVAPGGGFPTHPHRDMEIITYVLEGALEHRDSMGNGSVIRPGDVQRMSAGSGVTHSEYNHSDTDPVHLLQIWIVPDAPGLRPSYEQIAVEPTSLQNQLRLIASPDGREGSVTVHQDVELYATHLTPDESAAHRLAPGRHAWVHVARGVAEVNGVRMSAGDGVALSNEEIIELRGVDAAEVLLFDLA
jgi:redox-sensitive bicupin YhaK (pirin superfamily)